MKKHISIYFHSRKALCCRPNLAFKPTRLEQNVPPKGEIYRTAGSETYCRQICTAICWDQIILLKDSSTN